MAKAAPRSTTRRSSVAGTTDPIHAAIETHARAYAAYDAQVKADAEDFDTMTLVVDAEHQAAAAFAATVPTTLAGMAASFAHVRTLYERDNYPMLDDWHCYVFIASLETALRRVLVDAARQSCVRRTRHSHVPLVSGERSE
jgi:hypothetical protein